MTRGHRTRGCWVSWAKLKSVCIKWNLHRWSSVKFINWSLRLFCTLLLFFWMNNGNARVLIHPGRTSKSAILWDIKSSLVFNTLRPCWVLCIDITYGIHTSSTYSYWRQDPVLSSYFEPVIESWLPMLRFCSLSSFLQINSGSRECLVLCYLCSLCVLRTNQSMYSHWNNSLIHLLYLFF